MLIIEANEESARAQQVDQKATFYEKKYRKYFDDLGRSKMFSIGSRKFEAYDAYCLGTQLDQYSMMESYMRENGSLSDLGTLPNIALDIIAGSYGTGVHNLIASNQPMAEENGTIYFKNLVFNQNRGGIDPSTDPAFISGQQAGSYANMAKIDAYANEEQSVTPLQTANTVTVYNFTLPFAPIKANATAKIEITEVGVLLVDTKQSTLAGIGGSATINYETGVVALTLAADPGATPYDVKVVYNTDFELIENVSDLPQTQMKLDSIQVSAKISVLNQTVGVLQAFSFGQRFGKTLEDDMINDLIQGIAAVASTNCINALIKAHTLSGNIALTFDKAKPAGVVVTDREYRKDLALVIADAGAALNKNAGRGSINRITAGSTACTFLSQQDGFISASVNNSQGPHIYGTIDGVIIVRAPQIAADDMYLSYISEFSPLEAPVVRGIYMPLYMTGSLENITGLYKSRTVAEWAAYKEVVPQFVQKITLT